MEKLKNCSLLILGQGVLKDYIMNHKLYNSKIFLLDRVQANDLLSYTSSAYIGLCIIENYGMSYFLSLPNKLFEYCHAGIPVIASNFPEIKKFVVQYNIGELIDPNNLNELIQKVNMLMNNQELYKKYKKNCINASKELNWEKQEKILIDSLNEETLKS